MATTTITDQDRLDAEQFLETFLTDKLPNGDFSKGSFLRDITISALAYTVALMRAESKVAAQRASIKRVLTMPAGTDRDDAADDALSNWFLTRKTGRSSRGTVLLHLSADVDLLIPATTRFFYNSSLVYTPDDAADVLIPKEQIIKVTDVSNVVSDRYVPLNLVSSGAGAAFDVTPATWLSFDRFSPYVTRVENIAKFAGGKDTESTDEFLGRSTNAISVRDLNSEKSIRAQLTEKFTTVDEVTVVGAGDAEMQRDLADGLGTSIKVHTGGFTDVYLRGPVISGQTYEANVGGTFSDPRPEIVNFRASDIPDFVLAGVTAGMIINVYNALSGEPAVFIITNVSPGSLSVSTRNPFPALRTAVDFSVGHTAPNFDQIISRRATGEYTRAIKTSGQILLPEIPVYNITKVSYLPMGGTARTVLTRENPASTVSAGKYQVVYSNPAWTHTAYQIAALKIRSADITDGTSLRVEFDTLSGFPSVHTFMADRFNRISCASVVAKGLHPVYVTLSISYTLKPTAATILDEAAAKTALAAFINSYTETDILNVSDVVAFLQSTYPQIGSIIPFSISYSLLSADGSVIPYSTADAVKVAPELETALLKLLPNPLIYGVSTRTTRVLTSASLISLAQVAS